MRRYLLSCLLLTLLLVGALPAQHEAEASGHGAEGSSNELLWKWANFALLAGGLGYVLYKKGGAFFRSRTESIRAGIEEADRLRREAEARVAEVEGRLENLEAEVESLRRHAGEEMAAENARLERETGDNIQKIRVQAEQEITGAVKAARLEVQAHAAELALGLAAEKIRGMLNAQVDQALVLSYLEELEEEAGGKTGKELN